MAYPSGGAPVDRMALPARRQRAGKPRADRLVEMVQPVSCLSRHRVSLCQLVFIQWLQPVHLPQWRAWTIRWAEGVRPVARPVHQAAGGPAQRPRYLVAPERLDRLPMSEKINLALRELGEIVDCEGGSGIAIAIHFGVVV